MARSSPGAPLVNDGRRGRGRPWVDVDDARAGELASLDLATLLLRPAAQVAPRLLGASLEVGRGADLVVVRICEVEAYEPDDPASHTFRGRTRRNATMYELGGHLYAYRSHGIHVCANVVVGPAGHGAAVLLRGGVVVAGAATAVARRGGRDGDAWVAAGPGRLCAAAGIAMVDDGTWLLGDDRVRLRRSTTEDPWQGDPRPGPRILVGPRVGVTARPDRPLRWWWEGVDGVSSHRRSPRAAPPQS